MEEQRRFFKIYKTLKSLGSLIRSPALVLEGWVSIVESSYEMVGVDPVSASAHIPGKGDPTFFNPVKIRIFNSGPRKKRTSQWGVARSQDLAPSLLFSSSFLPLFED